MKEKPILFSAPMVRAILDGRKTQTRRVTKHQPPEGYVQDGYYTMPDGTFQTRFRSGDNIFTFACPYGKVGDQLWVRESCHADYESNEQVTLGKYTADGAHVVYPGPEVDERGEPDYGGSCAHWWYSRDACPSIHLPRKFSRIQLEITGVRVELLQNTSETDAISEGIKSDQGWEESPGYGFLDYSNKDDQNFSFTDPRDSFRTLWDGINGKTYPWSSNPWVWVVEFNRVKP